MATESDSNNTCAKKLSELRVIDLRNELEKRDLEKSGNKATLIERLTEDLKKNGHNPDEYLFNIPNENCKKNLAKRTGTPVGKMTQKEREEVERYSDNSESNDGQDTNDSAVMSAECNTSSTKEKSGSVKNRETEKTGLEAADIVEDALQLEVDEDEFEEERDEQVLDLSDNRKENSKAKEDDSIEEDNRRRQKETDDDTGSSSSPYKSMTYPVVAPLTAEAINESRSSPERKSTTDGESLIVHADDTQSEIDGDLDASFVSSTASVTETKKSDNYGKEDLEENSTDKYKEKEKQKVENSDNKESSSSKKEREISGKEPSKDASITSKESSSKDSDSKSTSKTKSSPSKESKLSSKDKKTVSNSSSNRNIWVSGLSSNTRASDLQTLFKKYGKVMGAKIMTNPRIPGSRCYGFITMETAEQTEKCIQFLNKTELHGRTILLHVEKNRLNEMSSSSRSKSSSKKDKEKTKDKEKDKDKDKEKEKEKEKSRDKSKDGDKDKAKDDSESVSKNEAIDSSEVKSESKASEEGSEKKKDKDESDKKIKPKDRKSKERSKSSDRKKSGGTPPRKFIRRPLPPPRRMPFRRPGHAFLGNRRGLGPRGGGHPSGRTNPVLLRRIESERVLRRREREFRETERRRIEMIKHQREMERKQQEERDRIEREKEKLRLERERLEREKAEIMRMEREKARFERERIEREREEIRRKQFQMPHRMEDGSRGRPSSTVTAKRPYDGRDPREMDPYWEDRKRMSQRMDSAPPVAPSGRPSFDAPVSSRGFTDFDARNSHGPPYDSRTDGYKRGKMDMGSGPRNDYEIRRDSARHGGHDRDDRRAGGGQGYYRDSSRAGPPASSRERERGREDWKGSHESRRERYLDKGISSVAAGYGTNARYSGSDRNDWASGDRPGPASSISKLSYASGSSVSESRSRNSQPGLNASLISPSNAPMGGLFEASSNVPIPGLMSHTGMGSASGLGSDERPYLHSVRRF